jgi:hypothetical protein
MQVEALMVAVPGSLRLDPWRVRQRANLDDGLTSIGSERGAARDRTGVARRERGRVQSKGVGGGLCLGVLLQAMLAQELADLSVDAGEYFGHIQRRGLARLHEAYAALAIGHEYAIEVLGMKVR